MLLSALRHGARRRQIKVQVSCQRRAGKRPREFQAYLENTCQARVFPLLAGEDALASYLDQEFNGNGWAKDPTAERNPHGGCEARPEGCDKLALGPTDATRLINVELAGQPEYRRLRALTRQASRNNHPPFTVLRDNSREVKATWSELLDHVKSEGAREVNIQRYNGLGEMNPEQLWETTMNAETRTLLRVDLQDMAETEAIFSTLMGEDVEGRRKFIEENALDVRNLDV